MSRNVYRTLARIVGAVASAAGAGALAGGKYAHSFVTSQLAEQDITMPDDASINTRLSSGSLSATDAKALRPHAGKKLTTGPQALVFANNNISANMTMAATQANVPQEYASFSGLGTYIDKLRHQLEKELSSQEENIDKTTQEIRALAKQEIANVDTSYDIARNIATLQKMRADVFLTGNTLRGMLLNAYGWWLVGSIAQATGVALTSAGTILLAGSAIVDNRGD